MTYASSKKVRAAFFRGLFRGVLVTWPVLSGLLAVNLCMGAAVGALEGWGVPQGIYFASITALTIGYGDLVPTRGMTQVLSVAIGIAGVVFVALIAALAVQALQQAVAELRLASKQVTTPQGTPAG